MLLVGGGGGGTCVYPEICTKLKKPYSYNESQRDALHLIFI